MVGRAIVSALLVGFVWFAPLSGSVAFARPVDDSPSASGDIQSSKDSATGSSKATWPKPVALLKSLQPLLEVEPARDWSRRTIQLFELLVSSDSIDSPNNEIVFQQLHRQMLELQPIVETLLMDPAYSESAAELQRIRYRIERRLAIWIPVFQIHKGRAESQLVQTAPQVPVIRTVGGPKIYFDQIDPAWHDYLLIHETATAFNAANATLDGKQEASRKLLARVFSPVLTKSQREFVQTAIDPASIDFFKNHASQSIDWGKFLRHIELHELRESGASQFLLNNDYQNLLWSRDELEQQVASILDTHYRNANFRLTVSEQLINRMVPELPATSEPVAENILGARVFGQTYIQNQLRIGLIPDPERIHLRLETTGHADTMTTATKSGFVVQNEGTARFQVFKRLAIGQNGIFSERPSATSQSSQRLVGMRGKLDPVPVIGWIARRVARQQIEAQKPVAERYTRRKLERTAEERMQEEVEKQIAEMQKLINENLIRPLVALEMEPDPVQMMTASENVVIRYRLAGRDQLGANTARPQPLSSALLSVQMHQSAVNNFLDRIGLDDGEFTPSTLMQHLRQSLGLPDESNPIEEDATILFSGFQPIRVNFRGDKIEIELNLKSFQVGKGKTWRNINVRAVYSPYVEGVNLVLEQSAPVQVKGKRLNLRDQIAIRTIFNKVFEDRYHFNPIPDNFTEPINSPDLSIAHLVIDNGWLSLSLQDGETGTGAVHAKFGDVGNPTTVAR